MRNNRKIAVKGTQGRPQRPKMTNEELSNLVLSTPRNVQRAAHEVKLAAEGKPEGPLVNYMGFSFILVCLMWLGRLSLPEYLTFFWDFLTIKMEYFLTAFYVGFMSYACYLIVRNCSRSEYERQQAMGHKSLCAHWYASVVWTAAYYYRPWIKRLEIWKESPEVMFPFFSVPIVYVYVFVLLFSLAFLAVCGYRAKSILHHNLVNRPPLEKTEREIFWTMATGIGVFSGALGALLISSLPWAVGASLIFTMFLMRHYISYHRDGTTLSGDELKIITCTFFLNQLLVVFTK